MPRPSKQHLPRHSWHTRTSSAAFASTVAVAFFTALFTVALLLSEARKLNEPESIAIINHIPSRDGQPAVSHFWHSSVHTMTGPNYLVAIQGGPADRASVRHPWRELQPRCVARGASPAELLVGNNDCGVYSLNVQQPALAPVLIGRDAAFMPLVIAASEGGRWVVAFDWTQVLVWNATQRTVQWKRKGIDCFALRLDADTLICGTRTQELLELELNTGRCLRSLGCQQGKIRKLTISPDGQLLAVLIAPSGVSVQNLPSTRTLWQAPSGSSPKAGAPILDFSPCGNLLVSAAPNSLRDLVILDAHTGERRDMFAGHPRILLGAVFGADGRLYSWGQDGTIRAWDMRQGIQVEVTTFTAPTAG